MGLKGLDRHNDSWRNNFKAVTNADQIISISISSTFDEWNFSQKLQRNIGIELGDSILDTNVEETVNILLQKNR